MVQRTQLRADQGSVSVFSSHFMAGVHDERSDKRWYSTRSIDMDDTRGYVRCSTPRQSRRAHTSHPVVGQSNPTMWAWFLGRDRSACWPTQSTYVRGDKRHDKAGSLSLAGCTCGVGRTTQSSRPHTTPRLIFWGILVKALFKMPKN